MDSPPIVKNNGYNLLIMITSPKKPFVLIILDGFGHREATAHNPTRTAATPTLDALFTTHPHLFIEASGEAVGLPRGQMGNSEVGHLHIGAGRKVPQDLVQINNDIATKKFFTNPTLQNAIETAKKNNSAIHTIGLWSHGGVHSHENHINAMLKMIDQHDITQNYFHAITDGRDTPPKSVNFSSLTHGKIISVIGRYYAMDRDNRSERTQQAVDLLKGHAKYTANTAENAIQMAYARGETDEFISPTLITCDQPIAIKPNDVVIMMNFRADRARQLTRALLSFSLSALVTLTEYFEDTRLQVAYPQLKLENTLGAVLSNAGLTQLRLAETEKYAHVTYFFNGGVEMPNKNEDRLLIPSPKVATYDLQPEMSAIAVTDALVYAIQNKQYDVIICNYANPDMIGHTGDEKAAEKSLIVIDACLKRVFDALEKTDGTALITADHGNIEQMFDEKTGQPHTAHTTNLVPLIYVGKPVKIAAKIGALDDVAPTMLHLMGLAIPIDMTGKILFQ